MRRTACLFEGGDLIVKFLPPTAENVSAGNHNVNLLSSSLDRMADLGDALG
jgi:hypothetical protein